MKNSEKACLVAALLGLCSASWAQEAPPARTTLPASGSPAATEPAARAPAHATTRAAAAALSDPNALPDVWSDMSPEELEALVTRAQSARLADERQKALEEIQSDLLFEDDAKDAAAAILQKGAADTQQDNIDRIATAFAKADPRFAKGWKLLNDGKFKDAAESLKPLVDAKQTTYLSAVKHYTYAQSLARLADSLAKENKPAESAKTLADAVEAWRDVVINVPQRISFAVSAGVEAAKSFEKLGRFYYAMQMYVFCLRNYAITFSADEVKDMVAKIQRWQETYRDPMGSVAQEMLHVQTRLAATDSGSETQAVEKQLVAVLEDLIKTTEEKQNGGGGENSANNPAQRQGEEEKEKAAGGKGAGGKNQPSSPATVSRLVPGSVERPPKGFSETRPADEQADWSTLPPRQREKLEEMMRKMMSERYRDQVSDYHSALSKERAHE